MKKLKRFFFIAFWAGSAIGLMVLYGFVNSRFDQVVINRLQIEIANDNRFHFLDEEAVKQHLEKSGVAIVGQAMSAVDPLTIRRTVMEMSAVKKAEVFKNVDGRMRIKIEQRTPLCRIQNTNGTGFYLDEDGRIMPLSTRYSAHVLIFVGQLNESTDLGSITFLESNPDLMSASMLDECFRMATFIESDKLLRHLTEHIVVTADREFDLVPRFGDCRIKFGGMSKAENKSKKLALFYENTLGKVNLSQYKTIDLRFSKQVVCSRTNS